MQYLYQKGLEMCRKKCKKNDRPDGNRILKETKNLMSDSVSALELKISALRDELCKKEKILAELHEKRALSLLREAELNRVMRSSKRGPMWEYLYGGEFFIGCHPELADKWADSVWDVNNCRLSRSLLDNYCLLPGSLQSFQYSNFHGMKFRTLFFVEDVGVTAMGVVFTFANPFLKIDSNPVTIDYADAIIFKGKYCRVEVIMPQGIGSPIERLTVDCIEELEVDEDNKLVTYYGPSYIFTTSEECLRRGEISYEDGTYDPEIHQFCIRDPNTGAAAALSVENSEFEIQNYDGVWVKTLLTYRNPEDRMIRWFGIDGIKFRFRGTIYLYNLGEADRYVGCNVRMMLLKTLHEISVTDHE